ncbi:hypothetical protein ACJIZ3_001888 [Penstemon smallii]|uniref:DUF7356 domain-containing protein n=1 Tax=Penstemon smallii TaxID=265156 RepID=A0ABD3U692_9LAMI
MKISGILLLIVFITSVTSYGVTADSEEVGTDTKNQLLSKTNGDDNGVSETLDPLKKGQDSNLNKIDSIKRLESKKGGVTEENKADSSVVKDEQNESKGSGSESKKESEDGKLPLVREKCDSLSNSCMDDDKNLVACLRVPGNESPDLSLLIQNKGKGPVTVTISAPNLVQLEKSRIELKGKEDTEVKVSIKGVESGHFITLTVGHGNCSLDFRDQFVGRKKVDDTPESTYVSFSNRTGFLFLAASLIVLVSILTCINFLRRYFARKGPRYQKLDMELPVSHGIRIEPSANEGWDNSWGDSWDDVEAPKTPSLPVTPSLSSIGMASRKFSKDAWKD